MKNPKPDDYILALLAKHNSDVSKRFSSDVIIIKSPIRMGLDDVVRHEIENLHSDEGKRLDRLSVLIETTGGYVEVVERIHNVFRKHYKFVDFIVPNFAYSAGTVLVLSGDEIYMDYYSVLGPIDPQFESDNEKWGPGLGYLQKFHELCEAINAAPDHEKVRAELAYLLRKFDPTTLFLLEQAKSHSESLLEEWLPKYKFKNWTTRKTSGKIVTDAHKRRRARKIAEVLGDAERWHSHGRGIGMRELSSDEIKLVINDFGADKGMNKDIRQYYDLFMDYGERLGLRAPQHTVIHTAKGLRRLR